MADVNRRIVLASRPHGEPTPAHFRLEEAPAPTPKAGEVLLRNRYLSLDPYMRGRMSAAKSYAKPVEIGETMVGGTVSEVVASTTLIFRRRRRARRIRGLAGLRGLGRRRAAQARSGARPRSPRRWASSGCRA